MAWQPASPEARTAVARRDTSAAPPGRRTSLAPGAAAISCNGWSGPASRLGWTENVINHQSCY
jgi:hypothetical protein